MKNLLAKYNAQFDQLMYATRDGRKTVLVLENGMRLETFLPIRRLMEEAPEGTLICINKGILIAARHLRSVQDNAYTMADGTQFIGRVRDRKTQQAIPASEASRPTRLADPDAWSQYSILDEFPLAFCIIELVFDEHGRGLDFIFRYCNKEMEVLEGKTIGDMLNHSFYEIFENGDKKWLVTYADVALNGVKRTIESFSPEIGSNLRIYCYQPKPNFCACTLFRI